MQISLSLSLTAQLRSSISAYAVSGLDPALAFDFINNYFRKGGSESTITDALVHNSATAGNATMTDGYGPEVVANGTFDTDTDWAKGTGWTISSGKLNIADTASTASAYNTGGQTFDPTKSYSVTFTISSSTANIGVQVRLFTSTGTARYSPSTNYTADGTYSVIIPAGSFAETNVYMGFVRNGGHTGSLSINNVSVREAPAIKWRPHNLLRYSEDFSNADWNKVGTTSVEANVATAPNGSQTAYRLNNITDAISDRLVQYSGITNATVTASIWMKGEGANIGKIVKLTAKRQGGTYAGTFVAFTLTSEWQLVEATFTQLPDNTGAGLAINNTSSGGEASSVLIWGAHLYRSDLGGMVNNPETGDSYVRTAGRPIGPELVESTDQSGTITQTAASSGNPWWSVGSSEQWSISANSISRSSVGVWTSLRRDIGMKASTKYELTFDVSDRTAGTFYFYESISTSFVTISSNGSHKVVFTTGTGSDSSILQLSSSSFDGTISNISVKEVDVNPATARYLPRVGHHIYNGSAWVNEGVLHESEARTNLEDQSNDLSSGWFLANAVVTKDAVGPDGAANSAWTLSDSSAGGTGYVNAVGSYTVATSTSHTFSVFAKADQLSWLYLEVRNFTTPGNSAASFNLSTGAVGTVSAGITGSMQDCGNGWYRCSVTFTTDATDTTGEIDIQPATGDNNPTVDFDGTSSILVYGAQIEAGSTPSSYIPTAGATVTRAAETLTVPAANMPWPTPVVIGPELTPDPSFDDPTQTNDEAVSGWTVAGGELVVVNSAAYNSSVGQNLSSALVVGKVYEVSYTITGYTSGSVRGQFTGGASSNLTSRSAAGTYKQTFVPQNAHTYFGFQSAVAGTTLNLDNISVKEINPLSVSIQMDGRMTYADTGGDNGKLFRWHLDNPNNIYSMLSTYEARTGLIYWVQESGNVLDSVSGPNTSYSPDTNVPFNFASRHGSTFLNAAIDGTALTANTTPTALPDLSATDFQIGTTFMGTIGGLRVWADDLGDTGIVEATAPSLEPSLSLTFDGSENSGFTVSDWSE